MAKAVWLETTSALTPSLSFDTCYEYYDKDYVTSDPTEKYFGRQDKNSQFGFSLTHEARRFDWGLEYEFTNLDSTDSSRDETSHDVKLVIEGKF